MGDPRVIANRPNKDRNTLQAPDGAGGPEGRCSERCRSLHENPMEIAPRGTVLIGGDPKLGIEECQVRGLKRA